MRDHGLQFWDEHLCHTFRATSPSAGCPSAPDAAPAPGGGVAMRLNVSSASSSATLGTDEGLSAGGRGGTRGAESTGYGGGIAATGGPAGAGGLSCRPGTGGGGTLRPAVEDCAGFDMSSLSFILFKFPTLASDDVRLLVEQPMASSTLVHRLSIQRQEGEGCILSELQKGGAYIQ